MVGVTADTNIYISALVFAGLPRRFIQAAEAGRFHLAISDAIRDELSGILVGKFSWPADAVAQALAQLAGCADHVQPSVTLHVIADEPDNRILECAVAAGSRFIVTGDNDLLRIGSYGDIRIVKVAEFMKLIEVSVP